MFFLYVSGLGFRTEASYPDSDFSKSRAVTSGFYLGLKIELNLGFDFDRDFLWFGLEVGVKGWGVVIVFFFKIYDW